MGISFGRWDIALVLVVAFMATALAYLPQPRLKAFVITLPVPFTIAALAIGRPVDATNVVGLLALLVFTHCVRVLHQRLGVHIILSIIISALGYCAIGVGLAKALPASAAAFWVASAGVFTLGLILHVVTPERDEPGHRTSLPVWVKFPLVVAVTVFLVTAKKALSGFMTVFPMVGVFAAYEARHCLWTISRQIPVVLLTLVPLMVVCRLAQTALGAGLGLALGLGWGAYIAFLVPLMWSTWFREGSRR